MDNRMTEPDPQKSLRDLIQNDKTYFMVSCEWTEFIQEQAIATMDNPTAQGRVLSRRMTANEVCNVHPLIYSASQRKDRYGYTVTWAMPIEKALYDWVMSHQNEAAQDGQSDGGPEGNSGLII